MKSKFIGVLSDTHISSKSERIPKEVFYYFEDALAIFHAGDITDLAVIDELKKIAPVYAVKGNMDSSRESQALLPESLYLELFGLNFAIAHGWGSPIGLTGRVLQLFKDRKPDCIVFGHTHLPFNEKVNDILLFNPGSTCGTKGSLRTIGILDLTAGFLSGKIIEF